MYYYPIISLTEKVQNLHNTKASHGGEKITVKFVCRREDILYRRCDDTLYNRSEIRIVFHFNMVYITEIRYNERFVQDGRFHGHMEKTNFSKPIKNVYPFDKSVYGYTYDGRDLEPIAMADLALKMYCNEYLYFKPDGKKYLMDI